MSAISARAASPWWAHAVFYEIYPRSFQDSNGDGLGDLNGIVQRLDYLHDLGVDAIWLTPIYPSPQVDFGYDIADYRAVDSIYGTMGDFDRLQAEAKRRGIRIVMDMVLNHTSDRHPWFLQSASSRTNPKADWYVWNDGIPAGSANLSALQSRSVQTTDHGKVVPPNNWESVFGGSAWQWVPARQQFYYHDFYRQQPDLNWRNPAVETAMFDAVRFWLDRGVAGLRLDAIPSLFEDPLLRNETALGGLDAMGDPLLRHSRTEFLPEVHDVVRRLRNLVDKYPDHRVLIGEVYTDDTAALDPWYGGAAQDELQLPMDTLFGFGTKVTLDADRFRDLIEAMTTQLHGGRPLLVFDNHDAVRSIDKLGDGVHDQQIARIVATVLLTTPCAALTYYGAELGMRTTPPTRREDVRDPIGIIGWPTEKGRDGERTPMQWTDGAQAGFSASPKTWLPVPPNHVTINVQAERADPGSLLNWYRSLIALRRDDPAMHDGALRMLNTMDHAVLSYLRLAPAGRAPVLVAMNMTGQPRTVSFDVGKLRTLLSSGAIVSGGRVSLPAFGTLVAATASKQSFFEKKDQKTFAH